MPITNNIIQLIDSYIELGGPGSGNWGHAGRKGKRGGSAPSKAPVVVSAETIGTGKRGINRSLLLEFEDGSRGIFKEEDMEYGSVESELLFYELSKTLGWEMVPETREFTYEGKRGSLQIWVEDSITLKEQLTGGEAVRDISRVVPGRMAMLDCLADNPDRNPGNILYKSDGRVWAIDNGAAFGTRVKGRPVDYGTFAMEYPNYNLRHRSAGREEAIACKELSQWRGTQAHSKFTKKLGAVYGQQHVDTFNRNLDTLIEWGAGTLRQS